ncbi:hypothetical protein Moror_13488 [Moniliophthora roreri MCA 2997]|uniref:Uncharacterized protein n=2 Tax=Moniliophthora roreri TaxID=221103 RepID=V2WQJ4_MONRO|nr:hypothetical protein Moror_13488 [Moniliophthora roreri MCA 2997]
MWRMIWTENKLQMLNLFDDDFKANVKKFPAPTISNPPQPTSASLPNAIPTITTTTAPHTTPACCKPKHTKSKSLGAHSNPYSTATPPGPSTFMNLDSDIVQFAVVSTMRHTMWKEHTIKQAQAKKAAEEDKKGQ